MNKKRKPLELYVHIPFCIRKCAYCDFVSGPGTKAMQKEYEEALLAEIDAAEETAEREVISVFFGGGTPSAVDAGMLARVMEKLRSKYVFSEDAEITLEANPGTLDAEKLKCYRKSGFNRISIGCQSVHETAGKNPHVCGISGEFCTGTGCRVCEYQRGSDVRSAGAE